MIGDKVLPRKSSIAMPSELGQPAQCFAENTMKFILFSLFHFKTPLQFYMVGEERGKRKALTVAINFFSDLFQSIHTGTHSLSKVPANQVSGDYWHICVTRCQESDLDFGGSSY